MGNPAYVEILPGLRVSAKENCFGHQPSLAEVWYRGWRDFKLWSISRKWGKQSLHPENHARARDPDQQTPRLTPD